MNVHNAINQSGAAGAALAQIGGSILLEARAGWIDVEVTAAGAALTDFAFDTAVDAAAVTAGTWRNQLTGANWADASKFHDGEESGDDSSGNKVNALASGGTCCLRLDVRGKYAARFRALGAGATVTIKGWIVG